MGLLRGLGLEFEGKFNTREIQGPVPAYDSPLLHSRTDPKGPSWSSALGMAPLMQEPHPMAIGSAELCCCVVFCFKAACVRASAVPILGKGRALFSSTAMLFVFSTDMFKKARGRKSRVSLHHSGPGRRENILTSRVKVYIFFRCRYVER